LETTLIMPTPLELVLYCIAMWQQPEPPDAVIPTAAKQVLARNAKDLDGLEFDITVERRFLAGQSSFPAELQSRGIKVLPPPKADIVRIDGARFYQKAVHGPTGTEVAESTYNGRTLYSGRPPARDTPSILTFDTADRRVGKNKQSGFPEKYFYWNYFKEAGYHLPEFPDELGQSSSSLVLHFAKVGHVVSWVVKESPSTHEVVLESPSPLSQYKMTPQQIERKVSHLLGESRINQEGILKRLVERAKAEPFRRYRFSLDPALGLAVREQWETTPGGELLSHTVCEGHAKVENRSVWLPKVCRVLMYSSESDRSYVSKTPLYEIKLNLNAVVAKAFSDKEFELWYDLPGGRVFDFTSPKATADEPIAYDVPGSPSDLAEASKGVRRGDTVKWFVILNVGILTIIIIYIVIRRRGTESR